eukprot:CAMPEP_0119109338 /NCGR_PEP_ID=MMETSP1180-20130426/17853_1 /TAXON_ID=3052 ORGANISM="Chlamydomonas cf sp, Strain CCMP681" /NCGR_SAMPLE_ID=MMETSP1180 /ASSEMBLY_ACC=CAM_ASM_000741 /LENGTH=378 /DNA_ID=CAMNT_0007095081 /DNA_START=30 /DNA_END=1167 /DNA_ORIENTATION=-
MSHTGLLQSGPLYHGRSTLMGIYRCKSRSRAGHAAVHTAGRPKRASVQAASAPAPLRLPTSGKFETYRHITEDGWGLELVRQPADELPSAEMELQQRVGSAPRPPLLFVHGSYHSAWVWQEHFMPYFAAHGFDTWAVSLRAQGGSDCVSNSKSSPILVAGTLDSHAKDLSDLIAEVFPTTPPVVVGHSFGGLILQQYVQQMAATPDGPGLKRLAGTAFLACVPPSGNGSIVGRYLRKDLLLALRVTWGFVAKSFIQDLSSCRELFFSDDLPEADLRRYQALLATCSPVRLIDLNDVNRQVPLPPPPPHAPPAFVLGGEDDKVVDVEAVEELAKVYKVAPIVLPKLAHDLMLDTRWERAAFALEAWLEQLKVEAEQAGA